MPRVTTGLDRLLADDCQLLKGREVGILVNQASVTHDYVHALDRLRPLHLTGILRVSAVFGPQHGLFGHTQDNMIEWEAGRADPETGWAFHSLYGEHRKPTAAMLKGLDALLVDLPDVGSRYYTFAWTMALCLEACETAGIEVIVLDRPNPIGGAKVEGTVLDPNYASFVGLYPLPTRHGMTLGEIARYLQAAYFPELTLTVVEVTRWTRDFYADQTDAPWVMPSPNMPTLDTALVYPGACLLEGTNLSEGRGTTRPFELFGAPYLDSWPLADALNAARLPGVHFRPHPFQPTFNKHVDRVCGGCFVHVTDRARFEPVLTYIAVLQEVVRQAGFAPTDVLERIPEQPTFRTDSPEVGLRTLAWKLPPYEYEIDRMPIDILAGNDWFRPAIEDLTPLEQVREQMRAECAAFESIRAGHLIYSA